MIKTIGKAHVGFSLAWVRNVWKPRKASNGKNSKNVFRIEAPTPGFEIPAVRKEPFEIFKKAAQKRKLQKKNPQTTKSLPQVEDNWVISTRNIISHLAATFGKIRLKKKEAMVAQANIGKPKGNVIQHSLN